MAISEPVTYDVVGVGLGPANLSLAIALEEHAAGPGAEPLRSVFLEQRPELAWHRGMLLPGAKMQISFLKDLVTFRNPRSRFGFLSYLHDRGRLPEFVNNHDFFPTRQEFHDYLSWAAAQVSVPVRYNVRVTGLRPAPGEPEDDIWAVEVDAVDSARGPFRFRTSNVVISTGLVPRMPAGVERDERVWHSSEFLDRYARCDAATLNRVAVVGAGQSAAEIVRHLHDTLPHATITAILPSYGYAVADDTPFANRVFDPAAVDDFYFGTDAAKDAFWHYHRNTNYSVVDADLLRDLYQRTYDESVAGRKRLRVLNLARILAVKRADEDTRVTVNSFSAHEEIDLDLDLLVCATGYLPMQPADVLGELDAYCHRDEQGRYRVERDYRVVTSPRLRCGIYLQGGTEHTHGLTSSLLSNLATRSGDITGSLLARRAVEHDRTVRA
ncbi:lysine N(6)-hydroxylase/L-ornithine N(5)-oxygenase family protein [Micromonospora sp. CA-248089]|uniref:lysine N(6)-hydroxylase/L-ornithine N(5)-oxygenase family protein n=1 Tax=Micromonospora sp. CA-248089 TaxID=3239960 RepID=UPI003D92AA69